MKCNIALKFAVATIIALGAPSAVHASPLGFAEAAKLVVGQVTRDRLYSRDMKCLRIQSEEGDADFEQIVIIERHSKSCGGDPDFEPVVGEFQVNRHTQEIRWMSADGVFEPYAVAKRERKAVESE